MEGVGYLLKLSENQWTLLYRNYYNNPSDPYIKEPSVPPDKPAVLFLSI